MGYIEDILTIAGDPRMRKPTIRILLNPEPLAMILQSNLLKNSN